MSQPQQPLNIAGLADLLKKHCVGDWHRVRRFIPTPEWRSCDVCKWHPLTQEAADRLNNLLNPLSKLGAPAPVGVFSHCNGELFLEWSSRDDLHGVTVNHCEIWGWDVMLSDRSHGCHISWFDFQPE